ncbi:unnamed protein product [Oncorhynchus mykiss]|uniref:Tc1-like transposase DDE domain-containing protein n=1 Tax=Oncorhynchus mykiss TaxID=8022 RepID=A0A061A7K0_ONCMY|nr:unnamed protein product [Oncorhynchus mykiss]
MTFYTILCFLLCDNSPFLFQLDNAPVHKARSIQKWFVEIGVEELDWPAQSPDLNPIEHLWDELEPGLIAQHQSSTSLVFLRLNGSNNVPTSSGNPSKKSGGCYSSNVPTSSGKPSQKSGGCYSSKGGDQIHINAHDFGMRCWTSRCPHTFGHVVYEHSQIPPLRILTLLLNHSTVDILEDETFPRNKLFR